VSNTGAPMFTVTQYRPYDNELQLAYPAKVKDFPAERVRREGDRLIVGFALVGYEAAIRLKITDAYIAFQLESLTYHSPNTLRPSPRRRLTKPALCNCRCATGRISANG